uniref:Uncharacterized protein n=1 Tax=Arundo donax TaxID=35708 RepID=A0A0A8YYB4_ARUDO
MLSESSQHYILHISNVEFQPSKGSLTEIRCSLKAPSTVSFTSGP